MRSYQIAFTQVITHLITGVNTQYARLSAEHAHYDRLMKSSDEMSTKTSRILVLVTVIWWNFRHNFSFVDEN